MCSCLTGKDYTIIECDDDIYQTYCQYLPNSYEFMEKTSIFNLGLYVDQKNSKIRADKFVGIMPFMKYFIENNDYKCDINGGKEYVKVEARFGDPFYMFSQVLMDNDDDAIAEILKPRVYSCSEWKKQDIYNPDKLVLCGMIKDVGRINFGINGKVPIYMINIQSVFEVWSFLEKLNKLCRKALKNQSLSVEENLTGKVKGKIVLDKQIKFNIIKGRNDRNYCRYQKMSIDNPENRILKYTLHLCKKWITGIGDIFSEEILFCERVLNDVSLVRCSTADIAAVKNNSAYREYKEALSSAKLILKRMTLTFDEKEKKEAIELNGNDIMPFFIRMDLLFELYCRIIVKRKIKQSGKGGEWGVWDYMDSRIEILGGKDNEKPYGFQKRHIPDIIIGNKEKTKVLAVIDAKYRNLAEKDNDRNRNITHQILAYMLITDGKYGGFMYPTNETDIDEINKIMDCILNEKKDNDSLYPIWDISKNDNSKNRDSKSKKDIFGFSMSVLCNKRI